VIAIQGRSTTTEKERVLAGTYRAYGKWAGIEVELPFRIATVDVTGGGKRPFARVLSTHVLQLSLGLNPGPPGLNLPPFTQPQVCFKAAPQLRPGEGAGQI
jgi:hypothetical protein